MLKKILPKVSIFDEIRRMEWREVLYQVLSVLMHFGTALLLWKVLLFWTGTGYPVTVVLSGSMEPAFYRGDILLLVNDLNKPVEVGDIVVFELAGRDIPIVHRVIKLHRQRQLNEDGKERKELVRFLTKGDNNRVDDRLLYNSGQFWLTREDVVGVAKGYIPYVGYAVLVLNYFPFLRYIALIVLTCSILLDRT